MSAFCAEAVVLAEALTWLKAHPPTQDVFVYTDCLSLPQAISSRTNTDHPIVEMQHTIVNIALKANVHLYHVPGHSGVLGNEVAHFIASRAARRGLLRTNKWSWRNVGSMFRGGDEQTLGSSMVFGEQRYRTA
ncbi:hypothetical protein MRX96_000314 [Rhipicephalus microplus]